VFMNGGETPEFRILIFAKAPVAGQVKTRLIERLGAQGAKALYERFLRQTTRTAISSKVAPVQLWCLPDCSHPDFVAHAREFEIELRAQVGGDLGERLCHAAENTIRAGAWPIIVGCDCPELAGSDLKESAKALSQGAETVLGPTEDGGYFLLALRRYDAKLFNDIDWGTAQVLEKTRQNLRNLGWNWRELPPRWDVDRPKDYERLVARGMAEEG
jgi:uncharacterized protein